MSHHLSNWAPNLYLNAHHFLHLIRTFHDSENLVCQIACNNKWVSDSSGPGKASFCLTLAKCWSLLYHLLLFWKQTSFSTLIKLTKCLKWHKYYSHILIHWHQLTQIFFLIYSKIIQCFKLTRFFFLENAFSVLLLFIISQAKNNPLHYLNSWVWN